MTDSALGRVLLTLRGVQWILGTKGDPYALLLRAAGDDRAELGRRVRERGPLYWSSAEAWVTADHEVVAAALADRRLTPRPPDTSGPLGGPDGEPAPWDVPALREALPLTGLPSALDREEYERLRGWAAPVLGERALRRRHAAAVRAYRNRAASVGERFDLMDDLIRPATVDAGRVLLGVPAHRAARFSELSGQLAGALDATLCPPRLDTARRYRAALPELLALLAETLEPLDASGADGAPGTPNPPGTPITSNTSGSAGSPRTASRTAHPHYARSDAGAGHRSSSGLPHRLSAIPTPHGPPPPEDVLTVCALLALVGVDVATTLTGNAVALLLDHPDQWRALCEDPDLAPAAVAETLRHTPPVRLHRLYAREELELAETRVAAGEEVVLLTEAARRDPRHLRDPDRFDIHRPAPERHLLPEEGNADGLVGPAARLAAEAALRAIAAELPGLTRTDEVLRRLRAPITGGVIRFPAARQGIVRR
ncbi:P450-derived glycosyltransferase activator [Streptomyces sp. NRRL S-337]|uniref:cytochrome P450 family protein n=1 Tax=Streptomyces sp. NRRL S-337 TaxID=1463900 RepID=UPI000A8BEEB9|nr:P450-derived glycosyltransferase activator [Streptomyces sp. NRRL S-337]